MWKNLKSIGCFHQMSDAKKDPLAYVPSAESETSYFAECKYAAKSIGKVQILASPTTTLESFVSSIRLAVAQLKVPESKSASSTPWCSLWYQQDGGWVWIWDNKTESVERTLRYKSQISKLNLGPITDHLLFRCGMYC